MSSTQTQRSLIDFLWEWAVSKGKWSQLLIQKITANQTALSEADRKEIFDYYMQDIGFVFEPALPALTLAKPSYTDTSTDVVLTKMSDIKGVNRLSEEQVMEFSPQLTIIYGNNGVGKTGYSRVLKSIGYSFDPNDLILSDVNKNPQPQSAKIEFSSNGSAQSYNWNGEKEDSDLNSISIFNSACVNISLSDRRELLVTPQGFYLFKLVREELAELSNIHGRTYSNYPNTFNWSDRLHEGTPQKAFLDNLNSQSDEQKLEELSLFTKEHETSLVDKGKALKALNKDSLTTRLRTISLILNELSGIIEKIKRNKTNLTKTDWESFVSYSKTLATLEEKTQLGLADLAETHSLDKFDSDEFNLFLRSADAYIKLLEKGDYPNNEDDTCIYCKQEFRDESSRNLVDSYNKILNDSTNAEIEKYKKLKEAIVSKMNLVDENIVFHQPTFGVSDDESPIQPQEIVNLNTKTKLFKEAILNNKADEKIQFDINYDEKIAFLETIQTKYIEEKGSVTESLANLSTREQALIKEISELKDRKLLSEKKEEILTCINNLKARKLLTDNRNLLNTDSLSRKATEAREELIANDFQNRFESELTSFRKQHLGVSLSFFTQRGGSHVSQKVANHLISDVLSEGEQKTIALCEFLTELQMDGSKSSVVFDDPVNSLDHLIMKDVATRLVKLSRERQVIIFTHNVLFYNSFFDLKRKDTNKDLTFKFYKVDIKNSVTGILSAGDAINKLKTYTGKLNHIYNNGSGDRPEVDVAAEGYAHLRTSLELLVSNHIFHDIVGRYRQNIMMTKFPAVRGDMIEKYKADIDAMFDRASGYIYAHSHPEEQHAPPSIDDLKADFDRFKAIESDFKN